MPSGAPWSVKGIDPRARAIAKTAARKEGMTLGEWLNRVILDDGEAGGDWDDQLENFPGFGSGGGDEDDGALRAVVDRLAHRLEAAERRSTLAISGVDQSLNALTRRLDALEDEAEDEDEALTAAHSRARTQHNELLDRVRKLERGGVAGGADPSALKAVESALGKLAGRLYETERDMRAEIDNLTHREDERGASAQKALKSVKSLADQVAESERRLAAEQGELRERVEAEARARSEAVSGADDRARALQSRIIAAENATHRAAETLAQSHERLESRLKALETRAGDAVDAQDVNQRFETLGRELADLIRETRRDCADQIAGLKASGSGAPQLEHALEAAETRLARAETRQSDALARIGQEVSRLARAVDKRIEEAERRLERKFNETENRREGRQERADFETRLERVRAENTEAVRRIGEQMARLGESLADRVHQAEARSANAVEQAGERMAQVVEKLETKRAPQGPDLDERIRSSEERTATRIEEAMHGVHARLDQARAETADALSPVQRAMTALADRLEAIENRAPAPGGGADSRAPALEIASDRVSLDPSTPLPQPPGLNDEADSQDWQTDPGAARDSFVVDAEAPRAPRRRPDEAREPVAPQAAPEARPERPAPRLGATADADFLASARKTVRANASASQWSPPPQPSEGGGNRRLLIAASVLGFVAVAAAASMLAMEAFNADPAQSGAASRQDDGGSLSTLFSDTSPGAAQPAETGASTIGDDATAAQPGPDPAAAAPTAQPEQPAPPREDAPVEDTSPARNAPAPEPAPAIAVETPSLEEAAAAGDAIARYQLALTRLEAGATADAAALLRRAAEQGVPEAMRRFGLMQARGEGVPADPQAGRALVVAAAEAGNIQAMHDAGGLFVNAEGVAGAEDAAARWFQQGALHGVRDSQFNMALLFQEGFGVAQSPADAYAWFLIAGDAGDADAVQRASDLRRQLNADQRAAAEQAARDFRPRSADPAAQGEYPPQPWQAGERSLIARTQTLLSQLGYDAGPADGVMGDQTRRAIVRYQSAEGLEPGGALDAGLVARLERSAAD